MLHPRITVRIDETAGVLGLRWIGEIDGRAVVTGMLTRLAAVPRVWDYDFVIDLTRFEGHLHPADVDALSQGWHAMAGGRDAGRRTAIITRDPLLAARLNMTRAAFPGREIALFGSVPEAEAWLRRSSHRAA